MKKRILIVDDDETNREILQHILGAEYELAEAVDGEDGCREVRDFGPDLVLLDIMMPGMDGYTACRQIKTSPHGAMTLVALISARSSTQERLRGYDSGADDYIVKPFVPAELAARVETLFRLRGSLVELARANAQIQIHNSELEQLVLDRAAEVIETRDVAVFALAKLAESRDPETGEHLERMRRYAQILAEHLSRSGPYADEIGADFLRDLFLSSPLHDIGKVGIPDVVLLKPGQLSTAEFEIMKRHTVIGAEALEEATGHTESGGFLNMAASIARSHHERFNGNGYPDGLAGLDIPLPCRIVALADVYDALTSVRVYKAAFEPEVAKAMIEQETGEHFDPVIVDAFQERYEDFVAVRQNHQGIQEELTAV